jgi:hypothetical protein
MTYEQAKAVALAVLPASGTMPFADWIDESIKQGAERAHLRNWPDMKARGELATSLVMDNGRYVLHVGRGG